MCSFGQEGLYLASFLITQAEARRANRSRDLPGGPHPYNGRSHRRIAQGPRNGDFASRAVMTSANSAQQFGEIQVARQVGLLEVWRAAAEIVLGQRGHPLARHGAAEQAGL